MNTATASASSFPLTRAVVLIFATCSLLFLLAVALRLNGSSSPVWYAYLSDLEEAKGLIAGSPKPTRADEWMVWTPAILSQINHRPALPIKNESLGAGVSPLVMSVPVRHYSMFFRPQLWGFFLFDAERGFAWYWNAKIFAFLLSFFVLFLALMRGRVALALLASVAVSYSSFIQWWFSSPSMLPEMLSSWAAMLVGFWILFRPERLWVKLVAALFVIVAVVNFLLCCYPPYEVLLVYLALFLFGAFLCKRRGASLHGGFFWSGGCLLLVAALLWPMFEQCRPTLELIAHTSYPGARRTAGGQINPARLFFGVLNFFDGERRHADSVANASLAANFFPLWLLALLFLAWKIWRERRHPRTTEVTLARSNALLIALAAYVIFFSIYAAVGLPEWLSRIGFLSFCTEQSSLLGIGVGGLMLTFLMLRADDAPILTRSWRIGGVIAVFLLLCGYLLSIRPENPVFLANRRFFLLLAVGTLLGATYLCAKPIVFNSFFAGALLLNNFLINPIAQGLPSLIESSAARHVAALHQKDPESVWAAYEGIILPQLLIASGARVLNGVKVVPDLDFLAAFDPAGTRREIYNRYAFVLFLFPRPSVSRPHFELASPDAYRLFVRPTDPALRRAGLKYVVFPRLLSEGEAVGMQLIDTISSSQIFIYKLD